MSYQKNLIFALVSCCLLASLNASWFAAPSKEQQSMILCGAIGLAMFTRECFIAQKRSILYQAKVHELEEQREQNSLQKQCHDKERKNRIASYSEANKTITRYEGEIFTLKNTKLELFRQLKVLPRDSHLSLHATIAQLEQQLIQIQQLPSQLKQALAQAQKVNKKHLNTIKKLNKMIGILGRRQKRQKQQKGYECREEERSRRVCMLSGYRDYAE